MTLGQRIRAARTAAGMTQEQAAYWCECERTNISGIESGQHEPRLSTLRKLADTYGCTVSELIGEKPPAQRRMNVKERRIVDTVLEALRAA